MTECLIGDGNVDGFWNLEFFVDAAGENPDSDTRESDDVIPIPTPSNPDGSTPFLPTGGGGGSSSSCNSGMMSFALLLPVLGFAIKNKKR